ncbi:MAG TPA: hypothetical protein VFW48_05405 [Solirubrobacterales bacterium]|nr:hypothetical protein [Solirubrobacterales bacterium]
MASEGDGNPGKEVDRDTLFKMVRSAANAKLAGADGLRDETKEMRSIADVAEAVGDHKTASALRATLKGLVDAAKG